MTKFDDGWANKVTITVPADNVAGSGSLTMPFAINLSDIASVVAGARADGRDIVFTQDDDTTVCPHELIPDGNFVTRDGIMQPLTRPQAVYHDGKLHVGYAKAITTQRAHVAQHVYSTGVTTHTTVGTTDHYDNHQACSLMVRDWSDDKLIAFYTKAHNGGDGIGIKISTNANDSTAWETEAEIDPDSTATYSYPCPHYLSGEDVIYLVYRGSDGWRFITSSDDGATWSSSTLILDATGSHGTRPYMISWSNGVDRIDFLAMQSDPAEGTSDAVKLHHFYWESGAFHHTDGTSIGTSAVDCDDAGLVFDGTSGTDCVWVEDGSYDASDHPIVAFTVFPAASNTNHDHYYGSWSGSAWSSAKIVDAGNAGPVPSHSNWTVAFAAFDPADPTILYLPVMVSGVYEIQKWKNTAGTWAKSSDADGDVTSGSTTNHFWPTIAKNCPAGTGGRLLFDSPRSFDGIGDWFSGITAFPALNSSFDIACVLLPVNGSTDTDISIFYGNASAADQRDHEGAWANYLRVYHTTEHCGAAPGRFRDATGNSTDSQRIIDASPDDYVATIGESPNSAVGASVPFNGSSQYMSLGSPNLASFTGVSLECWVKSDLSDASDEQRLFTPATLDTSKADFLSRLDETDGTIDWGITREADSFISGSTSATVTTNTWTYLCGGWSAGGGLTHRINQTENSVGSSTGSGVDATTSSDLLFGHSSSDSFLKGNAAELRITDNVYLTKDQTDTQYDNWDQGNAFFTIGTGEGPPAGGNVPYLATGFGYTGIANHGSGRGFGQTGVAVH